MLAAVSTSALIGIDAQPVEVQVEVRNGLPRVAIIGLGDSAVREARDRVTAALKHSGFFIPDQILVNLAPAELRKEGASFDLAIALGVLAASEQLPRESLAGIHFHGELSLDGAIKPVRGILASTIDALRSNARAVVVPKANLAEARLIAGIDAAPAQHLTELVVQLRACALEFSRENAPVTEVSTRHALLDEVWGQERAKRALTIAAAGGHNLLMIGPPGCGKSMLAERFYSILPPLSNEEALEVIKIHSVAGLPIRQYLRGERPFRAPHHVISDAGLIGGGPVPRPGEISLAHAGVLFLDEFPEYRRSALEALRTPLERGTVQITRARQSALFPARFQLLAAMNPCPCGRLGSVGSCSCTRAMLAAYLKKLSGPILDRIDLHVDLEAVPLSAMNAPQVPASNGIEPTRAMCVLEARKKQDTRQQKLNCLLSGQELRSTALLTHAALELLERAAQKMQLSGRGYVRVLRVARTIADLEGSESVEAAHIAESISYRSLERIQRYCSGEPS